MSTTALLPAAPAPDEPPTPATTPPAPWPPQVTLQDIKAWLQAKDPAAIVAQSFPIYSEHCLVASYLYETTGGDERWHGARFSVAHGWYRTPVTHSPSPEEVAHLDWHTNRLVDLYDTAHNDWREHLPPTAPDKPEPVFTLTAAAALEMVTCLENQNPTYSVGSVAYSSQ